MNNTSFRDPEGFVYKYNDLIYRYVSQDYKNDYDFFKSSGLLNKLNEKKYLLRHEEVFENHLNKNCWYITLLPQQLSVISQPSQWSFSMLKDAALLTLKIQKLCIREGMSLKDATPFNVQFLRGRAIFIDTTSFEICNFEKPWIAYRQFCESFLAPLALMHYGGVELGKISESFPNGLPLEQIVGLLPFKAKFNWGIYLHLILHAKYKTTRKITENEEVKGGVFSKSKTIKIIDHLIDVIESLTPKKITDKNWDDYYENTILGDNYLQNKIKSFELLTETLEVDRAVDLGCNDGVFSNIIASRVMEVISCDFDRHCIDKLYLENKKNKDSKLSTFCLDLAAPTPSIGFINKERLGFFDSIKGDLVFGLALIHHLRISNNIPLENILNMFYLISTKFVIIEFVPKSDLKVKELLSTREDIFSDYTLENFKELSIKKFTILNEITILNSERTLLLLAKK